MFQTMIAWCCQPNKMGHRQHPHQTRARLGRVPQLSREQAKFPRILSQNSQNNLEGQGQLPPYSTPAESIPRFMFGANLVILAQICDELSSRQAKFPRILSQNGKMTLKVTVNDLHFPYQLRVSHDACLVQIW